MVWIAALASAAVLAASGYGFLWNAHQASDAAFSGMKIRAELAASKIATAVQSSRSTVESLASSAAIVSVLQGAEGCQLQTDPGAVFTSVRLDIVDVTGRVRCSSNGGAGPNREHRGSSWLKTVLSADRTVVTWDGVDPSTNLGAISVAAPVTSDGAAVGSAVMFLHLPWLSAALGHELGGALPWEFVIEDADAEKIVSSGATASGDAPSASTNLPSSTAGTWASPDGTRLFASASVPSSSLRVVVTVPKSAVLSASRGVLWRHGAIGVLTIAILLLGLILLDRRVGHPLRLVTRALDLNPIGGSRQRVPESGTAEVIALARAINRMDDVRDGHEAQLAHQASHDLLTGLPNRSLLRQRLEALINGEPDVDLALITIGLDRFNAINDGLGYAAGDGVLRVVGERLHSLVENAEVVARTGGDEFTVLLVNVDVQASIDLAVRLVQGVSETIVRPSDGLVVRAKAGVTWGRPGAGDSGASGAERLLREANTAMRHSKTSGGQWSRYDATQDVGAAYQLQVEQDLRLALQRDELVVYYQPLIDIGSGTVTGAEALVRWQHPERGLVPPLEFIAAAEASGQISQLGEFVLDTACQEAARWARAGYPARVSVNVAVEQIEGGAFPETVAKALARSGLPADSLCLEITESSIMRSGGQRSRDLQRLRDLGAHLAVDDFGTGYSSLAYLHQLPVDELKIDRSFITQLEGDDRERHMVQAIISMATALGLHTVAEGVENQAQLDYLTAWGCTTAQGYLFSAPQPAASFFARLTAGDKHDGSVFVAEPDSPSTVLPTGQP